ncbi:MAG: hypothetical protein ACK41T_02200 [Pseudobdellovibrio sp.]
MKKAELLFFIIGVCLSVLMFKTTMIHTDNTQLMDKVVKIQETGVWTHHGNAATKMGSLPGSFLTFVTAAPMMLWFNPYAACAVILFFHIMSYFILRKICVDLIANFNPLYLSVLYWLNPWRIEQSELYNPGYLFFFGALFLFCLYRMHESKIKNKGSFFYSLLLVVTLGFCMQVHFSVLILGVAALYFYLKKAVKVNYLGVFFGLLIVAGSLVPWYLSLQHGVSPNIKTDTSTFLGKNFILVYPVVKAIVYVFRMGSLYCGRHIFSEINFDWAASAPLIQISLSFIFHLMKWVLAALSLILSFKYFGSWLSRNFNLNSGSFFAKNRMFLFSPSCEESFSDLLVNAIFIGVFVSASLSPVEFNHWHFVVCFPVVIFLILFNFKTYLEWPEWLKRRLLKISFINDQKINLREACVINFLAGIFIVWGIFMSLGSRTHSINNDYARDFQKHYYPVTSSDSN